MTFRCFFIIVKMRLFILWKYTNIAFWHLSTPCLKHAISCPSPRFCQSSLCDPTSQTPNFRATFGILCPFLPHVQPCLDGSPLETSFPAFSASFGHHCLTVPKFVECFFSVPEPMQSTFYTLLHLILTGIQ